MEVDESLKRGVEHLKTIFDLCDQDKDGCISAEDFRSIGLEHFGKTQFHCDNVNERKHWMWTVDITMNKFNKRMEIDMLIHEMDPERSEHISFTMFCHGVEVYLLEHQQLPSSTSTSVCSLTSSTEENTSTTELSSTGGYDSAFSNEDIYPLDQRFATYLSNGYQPGILSHQSLTGTGVELVVDPCDCTDVNTPPKRGARRLSRSSPSPTGYTDSPVTVSRESPTQLARQLLRRHNQLALPDSPSQGSTPAELVDEEVSKLSDQLTELSSKLEDLQEDHKDSEGYRRRLKRENTDLKLKLEECEYQLRDSEETTQKMMNESQSMLNSSLTKVRHESEKQIMDLESQLEISRDELQKMKDTEYTLRCQVTCAQEELSTKETEMSDLEENKRMVEKELYKTREQLRLERESWLQEKDTLKQDVHDRDHQIHIFQLECGELQKDKKRNSITASDIGREIERLKKELEHAHNKNEEMQSQFLQEGKELLARNRESLAAEMDTASKEQVLKALQDSEEVNLRLHRYIDGLLTNIIEQHPELLEKR